MPQHVCLFEDAWQMWRSALYRDHDTFVLRDCWWTKYHCLILRSSDHWTCIQYNSIASSESLNLYYRQCPSFNPLHKVLRYHHHQFELMNVSGNNHKMSIPLVWKGHRLVIKCQSMCFWHWSHLLVYAILSSLRVPQ